MKYEPNPQELAAALCRNDLMDITRAFARRYCDNGKAAQLALIEGDTCYYIGPKPKKRSRVTPRSDEVQR